MTARARRPPLLVNGRFLTQPLSGVQRYGLEMTTALLHAGCDLRVLCPAGATPPADLQHVTTAVGRMQGHAWEQRELAAFVRSHGGMLWSPGNTGPVAVSRQIVTLHDMFPYSFPELHRRPFRLWYRAVHRGLALRGAYFAAVSLYTRDEVMRYLSVPADRICLVPNGVGPRFRPTDASITQATSARLGLPPRFVLALGTASRRKNFHRLTAAWGLVRGRHPDVELVLAGGAGRSRIHLHSPDDQSWDRRDGVRHIGNVSEADLPAVYSAAEALVMPSLAEGFGLPPLEALACGTPVVVSANSALIEMFGPLGAELVDPYSVGSIADGVIRALDARDAAHTSDVASLVSGQTWAHSAERLLAALADREQLRR